MKMITRTVLMTLLAATTIVFAKDSNTKEFAQPSDKVWRAAVPAASTGGNQVSVVDKDSHIISFRTKGGFSSYGYNATAHVEEVSEASSEVSVSMQAANDKSFNLGDSQGKAARKFFEQVEKELSK